jgi:hypothetical protein
MPNVEFNEEKAYSTIPTNNQPKSKMAAWLIKNKLAKDESGAQKIMLAIIIICLAITAYYIFIK